MVREISLAHLTENILAPIRARLFGPAVYRMLWIGAVGLAVIAGCSLLLWHQRYGELTQKSDTFRSETITISEAIAESMALSDPVSSKPLDWPAAQQMLERLTFSKQIDARIYDNIGELVRDPGRGWTRRVTVEKLELPRKFLSFRRIGDFFNTLIASGIYGKSVSYVATGATVQSLNYMVGRALQGEVTTTIFKNADGRLLLVSCVPLQPYKMVVGSVLFQAEFEI